MYLLLQIIGNIIINNYNWGNLQANEQGIVDFKFTDDLVKLWGPYSVIGRSIVIHEDPDDFGLGGEPDSLKTGHAGKRIVCGIIGYKSPARCV